MIDYSKIDKEFTNWSAAKGYIIQTHYRDDEVRAIEVWSEDHSRKGQIGVTAIQGFTVEITVFDGKKKRERLKARIDQLSKLLDEAEALAKSWLTS